MADRNTSVKRPRGSFGESDNSPETFKRQTLEQVPLVEKPDFYPSSTSQQNKFNVPQLHNLPIGGLPIVEPPLRLDAFFTDLDPTLKDPKITKQLSKIVRLYPPPIPPNLPREYLNGVMIPFIYPPPPVIKADPLINDNRLFRKRRGRQAEPPEEYVELAPLPFPPPNFMPYPLIANKATLTPHEVFADFLQASTILPRVDMVVASAAGSLSDIKEQATAEKFTVRGYLKAKRAKAGYDADYESLSDSELQASQDAYMDYAEGVDTAPTFDPNNMDDDANNNTYELNNIPDHILRIKYPTSNVKNKPQETDDEEEYHSDEYSSHIDYYERVKDFLPIESSEYITNAERDVTSANGNNKQRRRHDVTRAARQLEDLDQDNEEKLYVIAKQELLQKIENLRASTILLSDDDNNHIKDDELAVMKKQLIERRDFDLVQLKLASNYEYLRASTVLYQESNKSYRKFNSMITKKLLKLKNFFEYQKKQFTDLLNKEGKDDDIFDIGSREANKIFQDVSNRNLAHEIKDVLKLSISEPDNEEIPKLVDGLDRTEIKSGVEDSSGDENPIVSDFMPLVTAKEFDLITGNLPTKMKNLSTKDNNKNINNIKHVIFKSRLYDPNTSGSDTNGMESSMPTPKRRGRRSNILTNAAQSGEGEDEQLRNSEAYLLAKISKQFMGPQASTAEQLKEDLQRIGIESKWST